MTAATVLDHIAALSLGGGNDPANLAPACGGCNVAKAKSEQRYLQRGYDPALTHLDPELGAWIDKARIIEEGQIFSPRRKIP